jgi:hypothetical protein
MDVFFSKDNSILIILSEHFPHQYNHLFLRNSNFLLKEIFIPVYEDKGSFGDLSVFITINRKLGFIAQMTSDIWILGNPNLIALSIFLLQNSSS